MAEYWMAEHQARDCPVFKPMCWQPIFTCLTIKSPAGFVLQVTKQRCGCKSHGAVECSHNTICLWCGMVVVARFGQTKIVLTIHPKMHMTSRKSPRQQSPIHNRLPVITVGVERWRTAQAHVMVFRHHEQLLRDI